MKISVRVKPGAKQECVEPLSDGSFSIRIKEKPKDGEANEGAARALAEYFGVSKSRVILLKGRTSRHKTFEIKY